MSNLHKITAIASLFLILGSACAQQVVGDQGVVAVLGDKAGIVKNAQRVETAELRVVAVNQAQQNALKRDSEIAGYPITGGVKQLGARDRSDIAALLLDDNNYLSVRLRCKNEKFIGLRFVGESDRVEMALGLPCQQVIWAFRANGVGVKLWGSVLDDAASKAVLDTLGKAGH